MSKYTVSMDTVGYDLEEIVEEESKWETMYEDLGYYDIVTEVEAIEKESKESIDKWVKECTWDCPACGCSFPNGTECCFCGRTEKEVL